MQTSSMLGIHVLSFSQTDTMLPGGGTAQRNAFGHQTLGNLSNKIPLFLITFFIIGVILLYRIPKNAIPVND